MPTIQFVACRYVGKSSRSEPDCIVTYEAASEMVEAGLAEWSKGAKYLILKKLEASLAPASMSIRMGPNVIEGCAMGIARFIACRDAWGGLRAA